MTNPSHTIAHITQKYLSLITIFIYGEKLALCRRGFDITAFVTWWSDLTKLSPEPCDLVQQTNDSF